jgi:hypothetical protein
VAARGFGGSSVALLDDGIRNQAGPATGLSTTAPAL